MLVFVLLIWKHLKANKIIHEHTLPVKPLDVNVKALRKYVHFGLPGTTGQNCVQHFIPMKRFLNLVILVQCMPCSKKKNVYVFNTCI